MAIDERGNPIPQEEIIYQSFVKPKLDDFNPKEWDKETFERIKDGYLENKCSYEMYQRYVKEEIEKIPEDVFELLRNKDILELYNNQFDKKIVKEEEARKVIFLITNMRNVENISKGTDNLIVNALSGTGKDHITEAIFDIIPLKEKEELVKTTPKVLSYTRNKLIQPEATWKKTALRLEDVSHNVVNDDSFKVFLTANPNKINCGKTINKGKVVEIEIEGKPSMILTIANATIGDEQLRRLPNLFLDEGVNQTEEILKRQAKMAVDGLSIEYDGKFMYALSKLRRVKVKIPYAEKLVSIFQDSTQNVIVRTAFPRFLDYIKSSASFHQYQRIQDDDGTIIAEEQDYNNGVMCLKKTTSNILMIPLSRLDEDLYHFFKNRDIQKISIDELFDYEEIQKLGKSDRWIRFRLDFLVSKGFLTKKSNKVEGIFKPITFYGYNKLQQFNIPNWDELMTSNNFTTSNTSNSSNTSNTIIREKREGVNEVFEVNEFNTAINTSTKNPFSKFIKPITKEELLEDYNESS